MRWDLFCQVIDNYGDVGFCWRLARELARRDAQVRLWIDDAQPLQWLAGLGNNTLPQYHEGVELQAWQQALEPAALAHLPAADVLIEAFGCEIPGPYLQTLAAGRAEVSDRNKDWPHWINLEYLCAQDYVERMHLLPSPVMFGPAAGQCKRFFYPGFTTRTGGLLREQNLARRRAGFDRQVWRDHLLQSAGLPACAQAFWISCFVYEPQCLGRWLVQWSEAARPVQLLAAAGRSQGYLRRLWQQQGWPEGARQSAWQYGSLTVHWLPFMAQDDFDAMLWACDLNIVRGEDSLVRALWAGQPLLWHIYPQHDLAHQAKLQAFASRMGMNGRCWQAMQTLNAMQEGGQAPDASDALAWQPAALAAMQALLAQPDLVSQLQGLIGDNPQQGGGEP